MITEALEYCKGIMIDEPLVTIGILGLIVMFFTRAKGNKCLNCGSFNNTLVSKTFIREYKENLEDSVDEMGQHSPRTITHKIYRCKRRCKNCMFIWSDECK